MCHSTWKPGGRAGCAISQSATLALRISIALRNCLRPTLHRFVAAPIGVGLQSESQPEAHLFPQRIRDRWRPHCSSDLGATPAGGSVPGVLPSDLRTALRALARRDITVPIGIDNISAISR